MHLRDVEKPRMLEMRKVQAETNVGALQTQMQGMHIQTDEEEKQAEWPTDDAV